MERRQMVCDGCGHEGPLEAETTVNGIPCRTDAPVGWAKLGINRMIEHPNVVRMRKALAQSPEVFPPGINAPAAMRERLRRQAMAGLARARPMLDLDGSIHLDVCEKCADLIDRALERALPNYRAVLEHVAKQREEADERLIVGDGGDVVDDGEYLPHGGLRSV